MAEYLDQQQTNYSDNSLQFTYGNNYAGQTFKVGIGGALTKVKLYFGKWGTPANLLVQIQGTTWNGTYWIPDNTPLASEEIAESSIPVTASEITVTFTTPTNVVINSRYAIVIRQKADGGDGNNYYGILKGDRYGGDVYTDGKYVRTPDGGTNWYKLADFDAYFKTYVTVNEELYDINNDFRIAGSIIDINNDFRAFQTEVKMDIDSDFRSVIRVIGDVSSKFNLVKEVLLDALNNVVFLYRTIKDIVNVFTMVKTSIEDIAADFRTKKDTKNNINNDFRMLSPWQVPEAGEIGFQSAGKTEVKVYISSVEQTDVDVDSISITQILNGSAIASFNLGRAYDASKPSERDSVEVKYKGILLYKGYVTEINPTNTPEFIKISCQGEYWNLNKAKKYFFVGRKPVDTNEFYYETINQALSGLGFSYEIGNFIPQIKDFYGIGTADSISKLVQDSGNFSWFIKPDGTKILWQAGVGNIINLEPQSLETNIGLYQVIRHNFRENIIGLINKFRVQMGSKTIRKSTDSSDSGSGEKPNEHTWISYYRDYATPAWDASLEVLAKDSPTGYGWDWQDPSKDYSEVFRKYRLTGLNPSRESWSDIRPPKVETTEGTPFMYYNKKYLEEGFTIDYNSYIEYEEVGLGETFGRISTITFSEPQVVITKDENDELEKIESKNIKVSLCKELKVSYTSEDDEPATPDEEPELTSLMFYTDKMGVYSETIIGTLSLSNLSIQEGFTHTIIDDEGQRIIETIPSWNDTNFAKDYANWQLSKTCDKRIIGSIDLTIDAMVYYNIDLSKRIQISGIVDPINIKSITYNFGKFLATITLESGRYYRRSENIPYRGE